MNVVCAHCNKQYTKLTSDALFIKPISIYKGEVHQCSKCGSMVYLIDDLDLIKLKNIDLDFYNYIEKFIIMNGSTFVIELLLEE